MAEGSPGVGSQPKPLNWPLIAITAALVALSTLEYWLIFSWEGVAQRDKIGAVLAIVGAYGIGLGFFRRSEALGPVGKELIADLTSPNAALCWGTNLTFLGIISNMLAVALSPRKTRRQPAVLALLSTLALIAMALGVFTYAFFHALVVVPITYPALLVAAAVVNAFDTAAGDSLLTVSGGQEDPPAQMSLKSIVVKDKAASTAFIMGLPATVLAIVGKVFTPFFG